MRSGVKNNYAIYVKTSFLSIRFNAYNQNFTNQVRVLIAFIFLLLMLCETNAQENGYYGLQFNYTFTGESFQSAGGLNIEGMFGKRLSVNFQVLYGQVSAEEYYFYAGGGQALGVYLIRKGFENRSDLSLALPLGIMSFVVPESVAYRIPLSDKNQLAIYVSPFGYEVIRNTATEVSVERISYELGLRWYIEANHWIYIVPRIGMKGFYEERPLGASYGLTVMLKGKKKSVK